MKVRLKYNWFAASGRDRPNRGIKLSRSGVLYKAGVHEFSDSMKPFLPKSATILDKEEVEVKEEETLKDFDIDRVEADEVRSYVEKAEASNPRKTRVPR